MYGVSVIKITRTSPIVDGRSPIAKASAQARIQASRDVLLVSLFDSSLGLD